MSASLGKVAVIGAGVMGAGVAGVFAARGYAVSLQARREASLDAARAVVEAVAGQGAAATYSTSLEACLTDADVVSENVPEDLALKRELFAQIERRVPPACLLTSNTSSLPIGAIAGAMRDPGRLVGLHWFNPPEVMPLVEIVRGPHSSDAAVAGVRALAEALGKDAIEVRQDIPGFVVNRLQYALLREALHLVQIGAASIEDVDRAVETTLAPRWSASGPLRLMDLAGLDTVAKVAAQLMPALSASPDVPTLVERLAADGNFGAKAGRGFYAWTAQASAAARAERDDTVRLLNGRRKPRDQ